MSRPASSASSSRTRQINALLALVLAACLGVIYLDQTGKMGGSGSTQAPAQTQTQPGTDVTTPDLNSTPPAPNTPDTSTPNAPAADNQQNPSGTPSNASPTETTPTNGTPANSNYGNLK